jgi:hypothetical protein
MTCTAPVRGHHSDRAFARCTASVHGGQASGHSRDSNNLPSSTQSASANAATPSGIAIQAVTPHQSRKQTARDREVEHALFNAGLTFIESHDFTGALLDLSVELAGEAAKRGKTKHWLCVTLADLADAIDPAVIASAVSSAFEDALVDAGAPLWVVQIVGRGISKAAEAALGPILPGSQLCLGLRALSLMVCPEPETCPTQPELAITILKSGIGTSIKPN